MRVQLAKCGAHMRYSTVQQIRYLTPARACWTDRYTDWPGGKIYRRKIIGERGDIE